MGIFPDETSKNAADTARRNLGGANRALPRLAGAPSHGLASQSFLFLRDDALSQLAFGDVECFRAHLSYIDHDDAGRLDVEPPMPPACICPNSTVCPSTSENRSTKVCRAAGGTSRR